MKTADMKSPIINRADLQTIEHRTVSGVLTVVFWALWFYLWLPLLALLAWSVGIQQAYKYMVVLGGWQEVLRLLGIYTLTILIMGGALYLWATYNILRYGKRPMRAGNQPTTVEQIARHFKQGPIAVEQWRQGQRLYVTHDEMGQIARVDILTAGMLVPEAAPPLPLVAATR
jgi:biofilm PGA synthesis protein PgaD